MKEERPILNLPKTQLETILDGLGIVGLVIGLCILFFYFGGLPERIPTHYDGSGQPDGYSSKYMLWFLMGLCLIMAVGMWYLTRIPHKYNYPGRITPENAEANYYQGRLLVRVLNTGIIWTFVYIIWRTMEIVKGQADGLGWWFMPAVLLLTVAIPIYMTFQMAGSSKLS